MLNGSPVGLNAILESSHKRSYKNNNGGRDDGNSFSSRAVFTRRRDGRVLTMSTVVQSSYCV